MTNISFKALITGIISIVIMGLVLQLIFLLLATSYADLLKLHPELTTAGSVVSYGVGIIGYFFIMSFGGYITANFAKHRIYTHCLIVSGTVIGFSLITSVRSDHFTYMSVIFAVSGIIFTYVGGRYWLKHSTAKID